MRGRQGKPVDFDLQLFNSGSGAGGNIVLNTILRLNPSSTAVETPLTTYGTIGVNDSGLVLFEARGWTKYGFLMAPEFFGATTPTPNNTALPTNYSVTIYYTISKVCFTAQSNLKQPLSTPADATGSTLVPVGSWWPLPANSDQSGTGSDYNPLTSAGPVLAGSRFAIGFRAVLTDVTGTPTAGAFIYGGGVP